MGGVWEVLERHLPCLQPFIYRRFRRLTGGGEVFVGFYADFRKPVIRIFEKRRHLQGKKCRFLDKENGIFEVRKCRLFGQKAERVFSRGRR